jgi:hypothetical protein
MDIISDLKIRIYYSLTVKAGRIAWSLDMSRKEFVGYLLLKDRRRVTVAPPEIVCPTSGLGEPFYISIDLKRSQPENFEVWQQEFLDAEWEEFQAQEFQEFFNLISVVFSGEGGSFSWDNERKLWTRQPIKNQGDPSLTL